MKKLIIFLAILTAFGFFFFNVTDFDIWFHLADGKFIIENKTLPQVDTRSYTAYGKPYLLNSWAFDPLAYLINKIGGINGLNLAKAIFATAIFSIILFYLRKKENLNEYSLLFITLALFSVRESFSLRPQIVSYLFLTIFFIFIFEFRKNQERKYLYLLPLLEFLWVNFHSSFIYGLIFSGLFFLFDSITAKKINKQYLLLFCLTTAASLFHFFYGPQFLLTTIEGYIFSVTKYPIREYYPPTINTLLSLKGMIIAFLLPFFYLSFKKREFGLLACGLAFSFVAARSERFMPDLFIFLSLAVPPYLKEFKGKLPEIKPVPIIVFIILFIASKSSPIGMGFGLQKFIYPENAVRFIREEKIFQEIGGNLYNTYNFGGFLIWNLPEQKVFIDGRMQPYLGDLFGTYWNNFEGKDSWKETIRQYDITAALMTLPHTDGKTIYNQSSKMFPKDNWALVYYDDVSALYLKRTEKSKQLIDQHEYKIIDAQEMDLNYLKTAIEDGKDLDQAFTEINKGLEINPHSYRLHFTLSFLYSLSGQDILVKKELEKTIEENPWFKPAREILEASLKEGY